MSVCQIEERDAGRGYPRTCPTCKLSGTCAKGLDRKGLADRIAALEAERDALAAQLAEAVRAMNALANCVDAGCFCSEMEMESAMDTARATLAKLEAKT